MGLISELTLNNDNKVEIMYSDCSGDACLARRSKTGMRLENRVHREVQISLRVASGRENWDTEVEGHGSRKQSNGGR